ncbi:MULTISPECIES: RNA-binding S4 domain-containing protein [Paenibacillus]|uniref:RQC P-site tRNA stabilizing factor n=1 Tax=Paenibacillus naphthalenovorans TaxID=162209 RepID=A0A0U2US37_9BACL|nr:MULTISPECIES: RNA-binding S4 domain-containing protein [Paenibacillus]ALS24801.1 RNA-binding S4 domain-containing protein [Paenibacillus naphthalenovorans]NTZ19690.1 RNA-binding S4 domain-containing protein [Paenibacillus sp. JMULE4]GCL74551.1 RNA-binding S4 domain-containing protein [Paenibacillus naphthalenovorans]SDJ65526.1 Ribosomal 50S subunit-recycling heat shock protein, contains S4 domain [Paenibacillus naphthalenovorans]
MRLDKFLKLSRLIKRRTVAKDVSEQGRVWINGREAKPSSTVKVGDELTIQFGQKLVTVRVELLSESTRKEDAAKMYTLLKEEMNKRDSDFLL